MLLSLTTKARIEVQGSIDCRTHDIRSLTSERPKSHNEKNTSLIIVRTKMPSHRTILTAESPCEDVVRAPELHTPRKASYLKRSHAVVFSRLLLWSRKLGEFHAKHRHRLFVSGSVTGVVADSFLFILHINYDHYLAVIQQLLIATFPMTNAISMPTDTSSKYHEIIVHYHGPTCIAKVVSSSIIKETTVARATCAWRDTRRAIFRSHRTGTIPPRPWACITVAASRTAKVASSSTSLREGLPVSQS